MPARESSLRSAVVGALLPLDAIAVENGALPGTPDINYAEGWIELKSIPTWPFRHATKVKIDHFTPQQRVFHVRRSRVGGRTYVLLEAVATGEILLLQGAVAASIIGEATRVQLEAVALAAWPNRAAMRHGILPLLRDLSRDFPDA